VISDATKPRISFSLRLQPFNSSIGQRGGYGFLSGIFFVCWRYSRSFDRIKGLWNVARFSSSILARFLIDSRSAFSS
jgi:hypothetical protein